MALYLKDRWRKAQIAEEKGYRTRSEIWHWESTESWEKAITNEFSIDFSHFAGKRVLEVGCGCYGPIHFVNTPCFAVGLDPLVYNYRDLLNKASATHVVTGLAEKLPFEDRSFDIVLCLNVLDHMMEPLTALREIQRVIAPGGLLLLDVNVFSRVPGWVRGRLGLLDREHPFHFSAAEVKAFVARAGLGIKESRQAGYEDTRGSSKLKSDLDRHTVKLLVARVLGIRQFTVTAGASVDQRDS